MIILRDKNQYNMFELDALIIKIKAIIYARVSTQDQAQHGYSLESQIERCRELAINKFNYNDDEIVVLVEEGEMGDDPNRPALNHALYLLENGVGKKFIMLHPDRMSRYSGLQNEIAERVWACGADLEFVEMTVDPNNPESMFMFNIQGAVSQYNKAKILANSKRGRLQKAKNGQIAGLRRVYGYTFDKDKDILVENKKEKQVYLTMVDLLLNHEMSLADIARHLSLKNVPAPIGNVWYSSVISRILKNEVYTGKYYYGKTEIVQKKGTKTVTKKPKEQWSVISVPQYINEETYELIINKLKSQSKTKRGSKPTTTYLVKGIAYCGECGSHILAASPYRNKKTKEVIAYYYKCSNKEATGFKVGSGTANRTCNSTRWRKDMVDDFVWNYIVHSLNHNKIFERIKQITEKKRNNEAIQKLLNEKENIEKVIEDKSKIKERYIDTFAMGLMSKEDLQSKVFPIDQELDTLKYELQKVNKEIRTINVTNDDMQLIKERIMWFRLAVNDDLITDEKKQKIINSVIEKVVLKQNGIEIISVWGSDLFHNSCNSQNDYTNYTTNNSTLISIKDQFFLPTNEITKEEFKVRFSQFTNEDVKSIKNMYYEQFKQIDEICNETGLSEETVISIITLKDMERMPKYEPKLKRERDFPLIYDLHFNKEISLREIYKRYGFSPEYSRRVLKEHGYKPVHRGKIKKGQNSHSGQAL